MSIRILSLILFLGLFSRWVTGAEAAALDTLAAPAVAAFDSAGMRDSLALRAVGRIELARLAFERGQVLEVGGVTIDAFGRVYVTDASSHRLQRFQRSFEWIGETGALGSDPGQLRRPGSVARLGTLGVAVLDRENRRVQSYDLFGRLIGTAADLAAATLESQVGRIDPLLLATDRGGAMYVADANRVRLLAFDFSGRFLRTIGGFGSRAGLFRDVRGLAVAPRGELLIAERANARVQRLDTGGRLVASWSLPVRPGNGLLPVAVDESGRVAVADEPTGRLWLFDNTGTILARLGGLDQPRALVFDPDGTLLVAEAGASRLLRLTLERRPPGSREE